MGYNQKLLDTPTKLCIHEPLYVMCFTPELRGVAHTSTQVALRIRQRNEATVTCNVGVRSSQLGHDGEYQSEPTTKLAGNMRDNAIKVGNVKVNS